MVVSNDPLSRWFAAAFSVAAGPMDGTPVDLSIGRLKRARTKGRQKTPSASALTSAQK